MLVSLLLHSGHYTVRLPLALQKLSCQSISTGTIGLYLAAMSVNKLFLDSINSFFFLLWGFTERLLILWSLSNAPELTGESSCQSGCYKYRHVSFRDNKLRCYRDASERHYCPPAVALSNIIFLNVRRVREGAMCLTERNHYMPRNNAIISCVISPGRKAWGWEMKCVGRMLCVMHQSVW